MEHFLIEVFFQGLIGYILGRFLPWWVPISIIILLLIFKQPAEPTYIDATPWIIFFIGFGIARSQVEEAYEKV